MRRGSWPGAGPAGVGAERAIRGAGTSRAGRLTPESSLMIRGVSSRESRLGDGMRFLSSKMRPGLQAAPLIRG